MEFFQDTTDPFLCGISVDGQQTDSPFASLLSPTNAEIFDLSTLENQISTDYTSTEDFSSDTYSSPSTSHTSDNNSTQSTPLNTDSPIMPQSILPQSLSLPPSLSQNTYNPTLPQLPISLVNSYLEQSKEQLQKLFLVQAAIQQNPTHVQIVSESTPIATVVKTESDDVKPSLKRKRENEEKLDHYKKRLEELNNKPAKSLTEEEKEEKKKIRNRLSAKQSRDKKKEEIEFSSTERDNLLSKNKSLEQQVSEYKAEIVRLNKIILQLQSKLSQNDANLSGITSPLEEECQSSSVEPPAKRFRTNMFIILLCFTVLLVPFATFWNLNQPDAQNIIPLNTKTYARSLKEVTESFALTRAPTSIPSTDASKLPNCTIQDKFTDKDKYFIDEEQCSFMEAEEHLHLQDFEKKIVSFPPKAKDHFVFTKSNENGATEGKQETPVASTTSIHSRRALKRSLSKQVSNQQQNSNTTPRQVIDVESRQETKSPRLDIIPISQTSSQTKDMETGVIYSFFAEKKEENGDTVISLFTPFAYPLLDAAKEENSNNADKKKVRLEIYMPAHENLKVFKNQDDERIVRLLQIRSDNIEFGEAYFAFNPSVPVPTADNQNEQNGSNISHPMTE